MAELRSMRNIGREMARKLAAVGIDDPQRRYKQYPHYNRLPENRRLELKAFSDQLRGR